MPLCRKEYARGSPQSKIAKFSTGKSSKDYEVKLQLMAKTRCQIRHNAIEAVRVSVNKRLGKLLIDEYRLQVKIYPHVILRENRMIATAGADRLQEGMRRAYGKPMGLGARVIQGSVILEVSVKLDKVSIVKDALKRIVTKLPVETYVNEVLLN
tara:strand:- start:1114 stop:1575 length:462 start_codon:yes stop_codon:yes gene_type:complete